MHILVTNDDGVFAPGLLTLVQAMRQCGQQVSVVAPNRDWSGRGHVKTLDRPLRVNKVQLADGTPTLSCDGAPSDCVALAVLGLLPEKVDLVVAGINPMANLGHDVTYSGTVTAVMEGIIWGVPGVAFSLDGSRKELLETDYEAAAKIARFIIHDLASQDLPSGVFLNVNIPDLPADEIKGIRITRQGLRVYRDTLEKRQDPRGKDYYWIGGDTPTGVPEEGTDIGAIARGFTSITPLQLDLTATSAVRRMLDWGWHTNPLGQEKEPLLKFTDQQVQKQEMISAV